MKNSLLCTPKQDNVMDDIVMKFHWRLIHAFKSLNKSKIWNKVVQIVLLYLGALPSVQNLHQKGGVNLNIPSYESSVWNSLTLYLLRGHV